ncbi:hypothetical protein VKT23_007809 [Stygiomarasmius scandens]|uniref:Uncharacterized protein n=1 Tax=Marasmiellus scandens TaxID=2682957 RepID=A0ABR1JKZ4_9AGAR
MHHANETSLQTTSHGVEASNRHCDVVKSSTYSQGRITIVTEDFTISNQQFLQVVETAAAVDRASLQIMSHGVKAVNRHCDVITSPTYSQASTPVHPTLTLEQKLGILSQRFNIPLRIISDAQYPLTEEQRKRNEGVTLLAGRQPIESLSWIVDMLGFAPTKNSFKQNIEKADLGNGHFLTAVELFKHLNWSQQTYSDIRRLNKWAGDYSRDYKLSIPFELLPPRLQALWASVTAVYGSGGTVPYSQLNYTFRQLREHQRDMEAFLIKVDQGAQS